MKLHSFNPGKNVRKVVELHQVPRGSRIIVVDDDAKIPPAAAAINKNDILKFHNIDGMYSYCINADGDVVHLVAWAKVVVVEDE